jgi:hypothetical protein
LSSVALLCSGAKLPDKIFKEDIIVRVNRTLPQKDKRCDIWFFGDDFDYRPYLTEMNAKRTIGYNQGSSGSGWWEQYPLWLFNLLKEELQGYQPCIGTMALAWLIRENIGDINVYGMDLMRTGYFDGRPKEERRNVGVHDFDIEEAYIKRLQKEGAFNMNSKSAKKISNKAILKPKEYKQLDMIACKACGAVMEYKGYKRGCPVCNTING